jgi:outer membrane lipoprotein-sorting protein
MRRFILIFLILYYSIAFSQTNALKTIVANMNNASEKLQTAKFNIYGEERMRDGKMFISERLVKLNVKPQKVYFYSVRPDPGMEVLYKNAPGEKMVVNPGGFPFITLHVDPRGSLARKETHHSIEDMGFQYVTRLINYYMQTQGDKIQKWATIKDTLQWNGRSCIDLLIDFKEYKPVIYTVQKGENLATIAIKFHVNDYMLLIMNPSVKDIEDVKAGDKINVPNFYGSKIEFYIDTKTWLPVRQLIYDQKGLFEKYEFSNLLINPIFKTDEFTEDYKDYKF